MASISENTFGAKLRNAQDLLNIIKGFKDYTPPRDQESVTGLTTLINSIISSNTRLSSVLQQYKSATASRQVAYRGSSTSIDKILAPIKGAVDAQYGKKSTESLSISSAIKSMRATKLLKAPQDPTKETQDKGISQSERSYGSLIQSFSNLISMLGQFRGYNPSNNNLKISGLESTVLQVNTLNNLVIQKFQELKTSQTTRNSLYFDLNERVQRVKSYVKAQYGMTSNEYKMIKGLKI